MSSKEPETTGEGWGLIFMVKATKYARIIRFKKLEDLKNYMLEMISLIYNASEQTSSIILKDIWNYSNELYNKHLELVLNSFNRSTEYSDGLFRYLSEIIDAITHGDIKMVYEEGINVDKDNFDVSSSDEFGVMECAKLLLSFYRSNQTKLLVFRIILTNTNPYKIQILYPNIFKELDAIVSGILIKTGLNHKDLKDKTDEIVRKLGILYDECYKKVTKHYYKGNVEKVNQYLARFASVVKSEICSLTNTKIWVEIEALNVEILKVEKSDLDLDYWANQIAIHAKNDGVEKSSTN